MATVGIALTTRVVSDIGILSANPSANEALTSSGVHAESVSVASGQDSFWIVTALGNVWAVFGAAPVATVGGGYLLSAGCTYVFKAVAGHKLSVLDAT